MLENLLSEMTNTYNELLKNFCTGKKSLEFQNSWFFHMRSYFDPAVAVKGLSSSEKARKLHDVWQAITSEAVLCDCVITEGEQRVFLASLASIVYDMKVEEVQAEKKEIMPTAAGEPQASSSNPSHQIDSHQLHESTTSLFHYAGYALHCMIQTAETCVATGKCANDHITELTILKELQCNSEDFNEVPDTIKELRINNLCIVSPSLIPFVRSLVKNVLLAVNEEQLKLKGQRMVADAKKVVLITQEFILCVKTILDKKGTNFESNIEHFFKELGMNFLIKLSMLALMNFLKQRKN